MIVDDIIKKSIRPKNGQIYDFFSIRLNFPRLSWTDTSNDDTCISGYNHPALARDIFNKSSEYFTIENQLHVNINLRMYNAMKSIWLFSSNFLCLFIQTWNRKLVYRERRALIWLVTFQLLISKSLSSRSKHHKKSNQTLVMRVKCQFRKNICVATFKSKIICYVEMCPRNK